MEETITLIEFSEQEPLRLRMRRIGDIRTHSHEFLEIDLVLSGTCRVKSGSEMYTLGEDDLISIEAGTPHAFWSRDCTLITVQFDQTFFERMLPEPKHPNFLCNSAESPDNAAFASLRTLIARLVENNSELDIGYELRNWSLVLQIMDVMYCHFRVVDSEARYQKVHRYSARMTQIVRLIQENYSRPFTLSELADQIHLSVPYLSRFFEKQFGVTFLTYLTRVRLNAATEALLKSDKTIEAISADAGFPNSHAFVQAFRREYGVLPSTYRRTGGNNKEPVQTPQIEQHSYMAQLTKYLDTSSAPVLPQARSLHAALDVRGSQKKLRHSWRTMLTITSASAILLSDNQELLKRVQSEIGYRYIKFNGILSDDMHIYSEDRDGRPVYSFIYADKVFDFLLSIGLRPLVQLNFMPSALAREEKHLFGYLVSEPRDLKRWTELVTALILHLQERYGRNELRSWLFSVWDQPDTPASLFGFSSTEAFYSFYQATYQAVKGCDSQLSFGSPSTFYVLEKDYVNWYIPFISWCRSHRCMPDFLSFHFYDLIFAVQEGSRDTFGFPQAMNLRSTKDGFSAFISQVLKEHKELFAERMPIYLTEWNNTPSQQDLLNDTCFKSCYIVRGILENYDQLDSYGYWSLTDWMGEAPQPPELFFGGSGLFTTARIPKASYYAFTLLKELGDTLLGSGEGYFVTRKEDSYQVLLYNYRHFNHLYALGERFDLTFTDRYTPFSPEQLMDAHLSLSPLPEGEYLVTETTLGRRCGSAFDTWVRMGALELTDARDLQNLASRAVPFISKYVLQTESGETGPRLRLDVMLEMLEIKLLTIRKK